MAKKKAPTIWRIRAGAEVLRLPRAARTVAGITFSRNPCFMASPLPRAIADDRFLVRVGVTEEQMVHEGGSLTDPAGDDDSKAA